MIATGEIFLAIREIAFNMRKAVLLEEFQSIRTQYSGLQIVGAPYHIIGGLVITMGLLYLGYLGLRR